METKSPNNDILALSDGRAGNVAMSLGLAEAVGRHTGMPVMRHDAAMPGWFTALPVRAAAALPTSVVMGSIPRGARIVIGAGRRVAPITAALRKSGVFAVQILDSGLPPGRFDVVVTPAHDALRGANVITSLGSMHRVTPERLTEARAAWASHFSPLPSPRVAVLIGGPSKRTPIKPQRMNALIDALSQLSDKTSLIMTVSRRTGEANAKLLREALPEAWIWDGSGDNPYFGMLAWADAILVTDDSVNMASEAAATGAPVAILPLLQEGGKIVRFHDALFEAGCAEGFDGTLPRKRDARLNETGRIAREIAARFQERSAAQ